MTNDFEGKTCGIYPRVSSKKQAKRDLTSIPDQIQACREYAEGAGMVVDEVCVRHEAYTSTVMTRPELNQLLADMKARGVRNLIIDRVDRMTRGGRLAALTFLQ
jgi:DNA invertase Pin-like site-specific DNA recombinase